MLRAVARKVSPRKGADESRAADAYHGAKAENYVERRLKEEKWHIEQALIQELLNDVPDGSSVLDVPFGTGRFVEMYLQKEMDVHGLDISKDMLAAARKALGDAFDKCDARIGSADSLPYDDNRFDLVVCCRFLGLVPFRMATKVLSELHRVSRGRVILYMNVRKPVFDWSRLRGGVKQLFGGSPEYFKRMGGNIEEGAFLDLLDRTGFDVSGKRLIVDAPKNTYVFYVLDKRSRPK